MEKGGGDAAPTGCYKCGRPGHWSRDCLSDNYASKTGGGGALEPIVGKSTKKPKKIPKTRPKLTPELLLSNDGLGYVLRHFPRSLKHRGRGQEVSDLGNLLGLYAEWHSHLLPYYSFNQFVHKLEQVGGTKRVKLCVRDLRQRIANGVDPTKLHDPPVPHAISNNEQEAMNLDEPNSFLEDCDPPEVMLDEVYDKATEEPSQALWDEVNAAEVSSLSKELRNQVPDNTACSSAETQISEEQRVHIEANRLRALVRAAARARSFMSA